MKKSNIDLSSPEERGNRVRYVRDRLLGLSREDFCKNSEVKHPSLKAWELAWGGGLTESGAKKFVKRAAQLGVYCTVPWLMHGIGKHAILITKDINIFEEKEEHITKELLVFRELPGAIDTVVKDDAMIPLLYPDNYVGGIILENTEDAVDKECIVVDANGDFYVRVLKHGDETGRYNLICLNEHPHLAKKEIKNIQIQIVAPIIWIRRLQLKT